MKKLNVRLDENIDMIWWRRRKCDGEKLLTILLESFGTQNITRQQSIIPQYIIIINGRCCWAGCLKSNTESFIFMLHGDNVLLWWPGGYTVFINQKQVDSLVRNGILYGLCLIEKKKKQKSQIKMRKYI